jgi:hypothetical protein
MPLGRLNAEDASGTKLGLGGPLLRQQERETEGQHGGHHRYPENETPVSRKDPGIVEQPGVR